MVKLSRKNKLKQLELLNQNKKKCSRCKIIKSMPKFNKDKWHKDNLKTICKSCLKKQYENNKYKILKGIKIFYIKNKQQIAEKDKKYYHVNKEVILEQKKVYYKQNKEAIKTCVKKYKKSRCKLIDKIKYINSLTLKKILCISASNCSAEGSVIFSITKFFSFFLVIS